MFSDEFLEYLMRIEEDEIRRKLETVNPFEYIEIQAKLELLNNIKQAYIKQHIA